MSLKTRPSSFTHGDYTIGWICALQKELTAARCMLDELHDEDKPLPQAATDTNIYIRGRMHNHNVVIARSGAGTTSAAVAATHMQHTYPNIRFGLLVGIAGGAPRGKDHDIRLGDIIVSMPTKEHGGVVQVDFGTQTGEGVTGFKITGQLNKPPRQLINAVEALKTAHEFQKPKLQEYISPEVLRRKYSKLPTNYYANTWIDILFKADYQHQDSLDNKCTKCDQMEAEDRDDRVIQDSNGIIDKSPKLHYGNIASANRVMKYAKARDEIAKAQDILCFEEEAAGLTDDFPCIVVRGICDYADSHKNKDWQEYAALVAAAYGKELLSVIPEPLVKEMVSIGPSK
jgi:nucleoside phosphorylase